MRKGCDQDSRSNVVGRIGTVKGWAQFEVAERGERVVMKRKKAGAIPWGSDEQWKEWKVR